VTVTLTGSLTIASPPALFVDGERTLWRGQEHLHVAASQNFQLILARRATT
jgi:hypothetical protein